MIFGHNTVQIYHISRQQCLKSPEMLILREAGQNDLQKCPSLTKFLPTGDMGLGLVAMVGHVVIGFCDSGRSCGSFGSCGSERSCVPDGSCVHDGSCGHVGSGGSGSPDGCDGFGIII